jgi:hypothetical protein
MLTFTYNIQISECGRWVQPHLNREFDKSVEIIRMWYCNIIFARWSTQNSRCSKRPFCGRRDPLDFPVVQTSFILNRGPCRFIKVPECYGVTVGSVWIRTRRLCTSDSGRKAERKKYPRHNRQRFGYRGRFLPLR